VVPDPSDHATEQGPAPLDVLKALGDNTRYAIYLELARSAVPRTTADVAEVLGLHGNTVRPHLERMRDVGLLTVETDARGGVGRPQHRYALAEDAPALGLEPSSWPTLARVLVAAAAAGGLTGDELRAAGVEEGRHQANRAHRTVSDTSGAVGAVVEAQARLGFDPASVTDRAGTTVAFAHCPFRELAEQQPELVCGLHCGLVEGTLEATGHARVARFHPLVDRTPCQVELVAR